MSQQKPDVIRRDDVWVLRIQKVNGKVQEYRCPSEAQALQLAALLAPPEPAALQPST